MKRVQTKVLSCSQQKKIIVGAKSIQTTLHQVQLLQASLRQAPRKIFILQNIKKKYSMLPVF
jgi:hypothetical protein